MSNKYAVIMVNYMALTKKKFWVWVTGTIIICICMNSPCNKVSFANCTIFRFGLWTEIKAFFAVAMEMKKVFFPNIKFFRGNLKVVQFLNNTSFLATSFVI